MSIEISRRQFLAGSSIIGAGIATAGLIGCAPASGKEGLQSSESLTAGAAPNSSKLVTVNESDVSTVEDCDIVVCGSGSAGTYAAVRAAELGAKVIWLEKTSLQGGTSTVTEGINAPNTKEQLEKGQEADLDELFKTFMDWHSWGAYGPGIRCYLDNAGPAIDWAIEHGAKLVGDGPMYCCFDENGTWINMGTGMLTPLWEYGDTFDNLDFRLETPAVNLVKETTGGAGDAIKVAGVYAQAKDGSITKINAKAVVLATGGFGKNPAMCAERLRVPSDQVNFLGFDGQDGDGINMALEAGGFSQAPSAVMYGLSKIKGESWDSILTIFTQWPPSWRAPHEVGKSLPMVNQTGKRFYDETLSEDCDTARLNAIIASQSSVFTLFDQKHVDAYSGFDEFDYFTGIGHGEFSGAIEKSEYVFKANTVEELATQIGVDPASLAETIKEYNARAEGDGTTDPFGANPNNMTPLKTAPFYAAHAEACAYSTCGGVRGDYETRVLDSKDNLIPGLFVCGLDNGSMYYNDYPYGLHGGSGQANACTTGYVAANAACKELGVGQSQL